MVFNIVVGLGGGGVRTLPAGTGFQLLLLILKVRVLLYNTEAVTILMSDLLESLNITLLRIKGQIKEALLSIQFIFSFSP